MHPDADQHETPLSMPFGACAYAGAESRHPCAKAAGGDPPNNVTRHAAAMMSAAVFDLVPSTLTLRRNVMLIVAPATVDSRSIPTKSDRFRPRSDVAFTTGSTAVSSSSYQFGSGDIGKTMILLGAGPTDANGHATALVTTIQSFDSISKAAIVQVAPSQTASNATCVFGSDDHAAFQAAVNSAMAWGPGPDACQIVIPAAGYIIGQQIQAKLAKDWDVTIRGDGLGATQLFVTGANGFLLVETLGDPTRLRGSRTTIQDMQILTPLAGSGGSLVGIEVSGQTDHGLHDRSFVMQNVLVRSMPALSTSASTSTPAYGFWDYGVIVQGAWRPFLHNVIVTGQDGWTTGASSLDGNPTDTSWSFSMTCGIALDESYAPELASCQVYAAARGIQMVSTETPSGPEGLFFRDCTVDVCREGVFIHTLTEEPQATMRGGHVNARDFSIGLFGKKLCIISDILLYNLQTLPTASNLLPQGTGLSLDNDATIQIASITGWNPAGGMATIVDFFGVSTAEVVLYTGVQTSPPALTGCQRGKYGTTYSTHAVPATVYPGSMTILTGALPASGAITSIPLLNTAGLPSIGAILIDTEWFTYDNMTGHLPSGANPATALYNVARACFGSVAASHLAAAVAYGSPADILAAGSQVGNGLAAAIATHGVTVTGCQLIITVIHCAITCEFKGTPMTL